ncbi:hypothetical protein RISW2_20010 [Roseivivax isoporae LMG 25204]|uniref:Uncharacterized protein n=1 Tax=Roseivivax isoporae LMG 25204 TaxID=1449351 RepID=X7FAK2_9RHOB|nr:hypothetical protein RISW2_20010 [Roseivivax isoporae LMG 25204]
MKHEWIIDVISDLRGYAYANGLDAFARELDSAERVARVEIASVAGDGELGSVGAVHQGGVRGKRAGPVGVG